MKMSNAQRIGCGLICLGVGLVLLMLAVTCAIAIL